jgi:hypothetical protein
MDTTIRLYIVDVNREVEAMSTSIFVVTATPAGRERGMKWSSRLARTAGAFRPAGRNMRMTLS